MTKYQRELNGTIRRIEKGIVPMLQAMGEMLPAF
jgi:hypothetical protein